jgi:hypothetical protein
VSQATIAAISDNFHDLCKIRDQNRERRHLGRDFLKRSVRKCVAPMQGFIVPNGCSTVSRR